MSRSKRAQLFRIRWGIWSQRIRKDVRDPRRVSHIVAYCGGHAAAEGLRHMDHNLVLERLGSTAGLDVR